MTGTDGCGRLEALRLGQALSLSPEGRGKLFNPRAACSLFHLPGPRPGSQAGRWSSGSPDPPGGLSTLIDARAG